MHACVYKHDKYGAFVGGPLQLIYKVNVHGMHIYILLKIYPLCIALFHLPPDGIELGEASLPSSEGDASLVQRRGTARERRSKARKAVSREGNGTSHQQHTTVRYMYSTVTSLAIHTLLLTSEGRGILPRGCGL